MNIKKYFICVVATTLTLTLFSGCTLLNKLTEPDPIYGSRYELDKNLTEDIVESINSGNKQAVKDKFSFYAKNYSDDFDDKIDNLFSMAEQEIVSYTYNSGHDEKDSHYGTQSRYLSYSAVLEMQTEQIHITVAWYTENDFDKNYEGICFMYFGSEPCILPDNIIEENGVEHSIYECFEFGLYTDGEQFYRKKQSEIISGYTEALYESCATRDEQALASLFCSCSEGTLLEDIEKLFNFLPDARFVKEQPYSTDDNGNLTFPSPSAKRCILEADGGMVKECLMGYADLELGDYQVCFAYCVRDDFQKNNEGINAIFVYKSDMSEYPHAVNEEKLYPLNCGIYVGEEVKSFI